MKVDPETFINWLCECGLAEWIVGGTWSFRIPLDSCHVQTNIGTKNRNEFKVGRKPDFVLRNCISGEWTLQYSDIGYVQITPSSDERWNEPFNSERWFDIASHKSALTVANSFKDL